MNLLTFKAKAPQVESGNARPGHERPDHERSAWPDIPPLGRKLVSITFHKTGLYAISHQIGRDINGKGRGISPIPFTLLELLDLERLLLIHPNRELVEGDDNVLMTQDMRQLLAIYVNRYLQLATDIDDTAGVLVFQHCYDALTDRATLLFDLTPYGFSITARPLVLLWAWLRAVFTGHRQRSLAPLRTSLAEPAY